MTPVLRGSVAATSSTASATPLLVLCGSLGIAAAAWDAVLPGLTPTHRVLRVDLPGHGASPAATGFTIADLADAVVALVDDVGGGRFAVAGLSIGGAIAVELATGRHAGRLDALAVICSDARIGEAGAWRDRAAQVRQQGTASMVAGSATRWFAPGFLDREPEAGGRVLNGLLDVDDESYAACCEALAEFDRRADAEAIRVPTVVLTGDADHVVTTEDGDRLAATIPGATRIDLPGVGHQANLEAPAAVIAALTDLLGSGEAAASDDPVDRYEAGLAVRRAVLGADYVDAALARVTPETADFQRYITETAWGSVWTRPGLDRRLRSAVTVSSLVTGGHVDELRLHLRAALTNGLSRTEVTEMLLQTAVYAGVPAANTAFGVWRGVLAEREEDD